MGWDPERDNFCLHDDDDLGIALVTEGPTNYVQTICENCGTLLGAKSCLWLLVTRAAAERDRERQLEAENIMADELLALAGDEEDEDDHPDAEEDPEK